MSHYPTFGNLVDFLIFAGVAATLFLHVAAS
jgi:hypothetical protein